MSYTTQLRSSLAATHLLKHPFYQAWSAGKLSLDDLKLYARQYYQQVLAFPRYVSATHSNCESVAGRQVLVDNLKDEDCGPDNHPELWLRFAEGLGEDRMATKLEPMLPETRAMVETFLALTRKSYASGLGALFAYEQQVPEVATSKIDGLKKFYNVQDERTLQFFTVHQMADLYHTEAISMLLDTLPEEGKQEAQAAAQEAAKVLWGFLDGVSRETGISCHAAA